MKPELFQRIGLIVKSIEDSINAIVIQENYKYEVETEKEEFLIEGDGASPTLQARTEWITIKKNTS